MHLQLFAAWAALAAAVSAKTCMNMTVPVTISARNAVFGNLPTPKTNLDATAFALAGTMNGVNGTAGAFTAFKTVSGTYKMSVKYCMPTKSQQAAKPKLQIMTHGIGFDKTYWDISYNNYNYSYVNAALAKGYHTLTYDRLGIGLSSHGNPRDEIQITLEVAALAKLTNMMRSGNFPKVTTKFDKIVHVGHSFGSSQTYLLTAMYPGISDGIVLTGFSTNSSFVPLFLSGNDLVQARYNQPLRFGSPMTADTVNTLAATYGLSDLFAPVDLTTLPAPLDYPLGYLVNSNPSSTVYLFLLPGAFDPAILPVGEAAKQPVAVGEALTLGSVPKSSKFAGPVLVFTGSNDVPFCGGACANTGDPKLASIPAAAKAAFPAAKAFKAYIQPNTAHGINFHYNATGAYSYIQTWLGSNGL